MARRKRFALGGILSGRPDLRATILLLLVALALGLAGGYLLMRRYPPRPRPPATTAPTSTIGGRARSRAA